MSKILLRPIPGFSNYLLTSTGQVVEKQSAKALNTFKNNYGHLYVKVTDDKGMKTQRIIRNLMAKIFVPKPRYINWDCFFFRDGNPENLSVENLFWLKKGRKPEEIWFDLESESVVSSPFVGNEEDFQMTLLEEEDLEEPETLEEEKPELTEKEEFDLQYQIKLMTNHYDETVKEMKKISKRLDRMEERLDSIPEADHNPEEWSLIISNPDYEASNLGEIRNVVTKDILKKEVSLKELAVTVFLYGKDEYRVEDLVLDAFKPYLWSSGKRKVVHIDGRPDNCSLDNLEVYYDDKKAIKMTMERI